ncbi:DNA-binding protein Alba [Candidatus Bathyarchaeota archaeon]|nr:DNA-binding protein Alba [Candidatus Bathyarchaeota archaeon]
MPNEKRKKANIQKQNSPQNLEVSENALYIGKKPVMNYVLACMTHLNSGTQKLVLKARGQAICRAVDTVEVLKRSFAKNLQVEEITISTEEVAREQGRKSNVSAVEITLAKP